MKPAAEIAGEPKAWARGCGGGAGQPLKREEIRMAIWPTADLYRWSRTINVHIQHLRFKLAEHSACADLTQTVPGVGYMLFMPDAG